jgi:CheY-like chemotaxis protein
MEYNGKPIEILLIEDNPADVVLTLRGLKKRNLSNKVMVINDGAEALDYIFARGEYDDRNMENIPRLILLDLKLPKVHGLEVLRQIKSNEMTKVIPVVVLTSSTEEKDVIESYKLGVNSYITKPVDFDKFLKAAEEIGLYWVLLNQPLP